MQNSQIIHITQSNHQFARRFKHKSSTSKTPLSAGLDSLTLSWESIDISISSKMQNWEGVTLQRLSEGTGCVFRLVASLQHCSTAAPLLTLQTLFIQIFFWWGPAGGAAIHPSVYRPRTFPGMVNTEHWTCTAAGEKYSWINTSCTPTRVPQIETFGST